VFAVTVFQGKSEGARLQALSGLGADLGLHLPQEVRHQRHERVVLLLHVRHDEGAVGEAAQRAVNNNVEIR